MNFIYSDEQKENMRKTNEEYVNNLRISLKENRVEEYFNSFGFKPRLLEIVDLLGLYSDGEEMIFSLYEYLIKNIKDIHIPSLISKLTNYKSVIELLVNDGDSLIDRVIKVKSFTNSVFIFVEAVLKLPNGEKLILNKIDSILEASHPTLIFSTVKLFEDRPYFHYFFKNNVDKFIKLSRGKSVIDFTSYMINTDVIFAKDYITNNLEVILKNIGGGQIFDFLVNILVKDEYVNFIKKNIDVVIDNCSAKDINLILDNLDVKYNLGLEKSHDVLIMLKNKLAFERQDHLAMGAIVKSRKSSYIKELIDKLLKEENANYIEPIGDNSWSNIVFKIGSKVLKLGWIRNNPHCPEHFRIIEPIYFEAICDKNNNPVLYIEIQDYLTQEGIADSDIQEFFDDIEKDNLIYIDPRGKNPTNFGFLSNKSKEKRLVLLDRDCVWKKDDKNINYMDRY